MFASYLNSHTDFLASFPLSFPLAILRHNVHLTQKNYQDGERIGDREMAKFEQSKAEEEKPQMFQYELAEY